MYKALMTLIAVALGFGLIAWNFLLFFSPKTLKWMWDASGLLGKVLLITFWLFDLLVTLAICFAVIRRRQESLPEEVDKNLGKGS